VRTAPPSARSRSAPPPVFLPPGTGRRTGPRAHPPGKTVGPASGALRRLDRPQAGGASPLSPRGHRVCGRPGCSTAEGRPARGGRWRAVPCLPLCRPAPTAEGRGAEGEECLQTLNSTRPGAGQGGLTTGGRGGPPAKDGDGGPPDTPGPGPAEPRRRPAAAWMRHGCGRYAPSPCRAPWPGPRPMRPPASALTLRGHPSTPFPRNSEDGEEAGALCPRIQPAEAVDLVRGRSLAPLRGLWPAGCRRYAAELDAGACGEYGGRTPPDALERLSDTRHSRDLGIGAAAPTGFEVAAPMPALARERAGRAGQGTVTSAGAGSSPRPGGGLRRKSAPGTR